MNGWNCPCLYFPLLALTVIDGGRYQECLKGHNAMGFGKIWGSSLVNISFETLGE